MIADKLLSHLEKVKAKGNNSWMACCPAHDDKNPSLVITEKDERVLIHCFSHQCDVSDIVHAVGLELSDLFPEKDFREYLPGDMRGTRSIKKKRFPAEAILEALAEEFVIAEVGLAVLADGGALNEKAKARMKEASNRFTNARIAGGLV